MPGTLPGCQLSSGFPRQRQCHLGSRAGSVALLGSHRGAARWQLVLLPTTVLWGGLQDRKGRRAFFISPEAPAASFLFSRMYKAQQSPKKRVRWARAVSSSTALIFRAAIWKVLSSGPQSTLPKMGLRESRMWSLLQASFQIHRVNVPLSSHSQLPGLLPTSPQDQAG